MNAKTICTLLLAHGMWLGFTGCNAKNTDTPKRTYYQDVKPILEAKCIGCHAPGAFAPMPLLTYGDVYPYRSLIKEKVVKREMPPWLPAQGCTAYADDRSLSTREIEAIAKWVDHGAPSGAPSLMAKTTKNHDAGHELDQVDFSFTTPEAYRPRHEPDDYRCFLMEWPTTTTTFIRGFNIKPRNKSILHHAIAYVVPPELVDTFRGYDAAEEGPGFACFGIPDLRARWLGAWAPGGRANMLAGGLGIRAPSGSIFMVQMHYNTLSATNDLTDQTTIEFDVSDTVNQEGVITPFTNPLWTTSKGFMRIPAGLKDVSHDFSYDLTQYLVIDTPGAPQKIWSVGLHMHTLATRASLTLKRVDGSSECLLDIPRWNFHWQDFYELAVPVITQPGDQIKISCTWDNSPEAQPIANAIQAEPRDVDWGNGTRDEMCLGILLTSSE